MPDPPPRAPTFPAFVDQIQEVDDSDFIKSQAKPASPSPFVNMTDPSDAVPTTSTTSSTSDAVPVVPLPVAKSKSRIRAILLWRDPKISAIVFGADMLFFYLTLIRKLSVLSVIGALFGLYLVIGLLLVNLNKTLIGGKLDKYIARPPPETPLFKRESLNRLTDTIVEEGNEISSELRDIIYCDKTPVTLGWVFAAFMIYIIGNYVSLITVFFVCTLLAFSVPLLYEKNKKQVDDAVAKASDAASRHIETGRRVAVERAAQLRETAAKKSAPLLEKAPPAARNLAEKIGLTPQKRKPE